MNEQMPEPEHWPTERMILEGHSDYATPEDLENLDNAKLAEIAAICEVDQYAPDECIPCLAHVTYLERTQKALETMSPQEFDQEFEEGEEVDLDGEAQIIPELYERAKKIVEEDGRPEHAQENRHADPHREIRRTIKYLDGLLDEALNGPPIPPRDLTEYDLALLVLAADKWVKMTTAQGFDMGPQQRKVLDDTANLVARLSHG